ncbi:hypothetical protein TrST_g1062 [Triparma strigata]|uniref:Sulfotransferase domain-containing protein n=1 Tax=Triparma strigata TaxID=1606541 RepID=A0A9W7A1Q2_9STRA|nr:hypothetical protein TrST_g1062 [Triparma strigata]
MASFAASMANMSATAANQKVKKKKKRAAASTETSGATSSESKRPRQDSRRPKVAFLGIGMQKAGTSWLYTMLSQHPSICLSVEKEVHYWDMHKEEKGKGDEWYESQFPESSPDKLVGEITPDYLNMWATRIGQMHAYNPDLKLIVLHREEISRACSAFLMWNRIAAEKGEAKAIESMTDDEVVAALTSMEPPHCMGLSEMGKGLENLTTNGFKPEQILVAEFEDVAKRPDQLMNVVFDFLGVERIQIEEEKLKTNFQIKTDRTAVVANKSNKFPKDLTERIMGRLEEAYKELKRRNKKVGGPYLKRYQALMDAQEEKEEEKKEKEEKETIITETAKS